MRSVIYIAISISFSLQVRSQPWTFEKCVAYAEAHNVRLDLAKLQQEQAKYSYEQSRNSRLPTLKSNLSTAYNFGLGENPTTGILENRKNFGATLGLQSGITLFNWFALRNSTEAARFSYEAENFLLQAAHNDLRFNILVGYLQILQAREQEKIARVQVGQTAALLKTTQEKVKAGIVPELNALELQSQLSTDSSNYVTAAAYVQQLLIDLRVLVGLDPSAPFDIAELKSSSSAEFALVDLQPEVIYRQALQNFPSLLANESRLHAAEKQMRAARGQMFPVISAFAGLNSRYAYTKVPVYTQATSGYQPTSMRVHAGNGVYYPVESLKTVQENKIDHYLVSDPLIHQLRQNFGQGIGLSIQVPLFNGLRLKINYRKATLQVKQSDAQARLEKQKLKQEIYRAYNDMIASQQKLNAAERTVRAAEKAYDHAQKRYEVSLLSTYDLMTSQNRVLKARMEKVSNLFDFKLLTNILAYYKGDLLSP